MPKSKEIVSTSESESASDSEPKQKKTKSGAEAKKRPAEKQSSKKSTAAASSKTSDELMLELGRMRYASVSEFKGKKMVNIREYYTDDGGDLKPGRKGIALSEDQWKKLKGFIDQIDTALEEL